jgi:hypothetical protein
MNSNTNDRHDPPEITDELAAELERLEQKLDRGEIWRYDEPMPDGMPNPLVTVSLGLSDGIINGEPVKFYKGLDRSRKKWSRLLGAQILKDRLIDGIEAEWNEDQGRFVETRRVGPVQPGELVAILFTGFRLNPKGQKYPSFKIERTPPDKTAIAAVDDNDPGVAEPDWIEASS